jgi:hypothetical protein
MEEESIIVDEFGSMANHVLNGSTFDNNVEL